MSENNVFDMAALIIRISVQTLHEEIFNVAIYQIITDFFID